MIGFIIDNIKIFKFNLIMIYEEILKKKNTKKKT